MNSIRQLVLGAARSGKTRFALNIAKSLAQACEGEVIYVATAVSVGRTSKRRASNYGRTRRIENWTRGPRLKFCGRWMP